VSHDQTTTEQHTNRALLLDTDLFFSVKITDTLKHVGYTTRTCRRTDDFAAALTAEQPVVALVNTAARNLDWRAAISAARAAHVPVIAFGSHVDLAIQEAARQAGATSVIANSRLASDLPGVLARTLRRQTGEPSSTEAPSGAPDRAHNTSSNT
jgi:DNA-binding NtrC family response regulator